MTTPEPATVTGFRHGHAYTIIGPVDAGYRWELATRYGATGGYAATRRLARKAARKELARRYGVFG